MSKINQHDFPNIPANKQLRCIFGGSKWRHAEEETIVQIIANYALQQGSWSDMPLSELIDRAKMNIVFHHKEYVIKPTIDNIVVSGDIEIVGDEEKIVVLLKPLGESIKNGIFYWL